MTALAGLTRVTISAPRRRIDVALPAHLPVADLLPDLLGLAGETLADDGQQHGGWLLRRLTGEPVSNAQGLHAQGIRDGEILHLVPAHAQWPDIEYDDVVEAIADGARQTGRGWTPAATRVAALTAAAVPLGAGLFALTGDAGSASPLWTTALGVAAVLLLAGATASRVYGHGPVGAALAGYAMPYALAGGLLMVSDGPARLLLGGTALLLTAVLGGVGVASATWLFVAGGTAGTLGALGALIGFVLPPQGAAAAMLAVLTCGLGVLPVLAIRFGRLPRPALAPSPGGDDADREAARPEPDPTRVRDAVRRSGDLLTGMLGGHAMAAAAASVVLVRTDGVAAALLVGVAGAALLLRSRAFTAVRQRVPVLAAGLAALAALLLALAGQPAHVGTVALVPVVVAAALLIVAGGTAYAGRPVSPYLGRTADVLDTVLVVSVVPIACAVLDLYATIQGIAG